MHLPNKVAFPMHRRPFISKTLDFPDTLDNSRSALSFLNISSTEFSSETLGGEWLGGRPFLDFT
jgi:hypothetical protein